MQRMNPECNTHVIRQRADRHEQRVVLIKNLLGGYSIVIYITGFVSISWGACERIDMSADLKTVKTSG